MDAIRQLRQDHERVRWLFALVGDTPDTALRVQLFARIRAELELYALIEENLFYPACEKIHPLRPKLQEAYVDHQHIRTLVAELSGPHASSGQLEARLSLLQEIVELHLLEEEGTIFPGAIAAMTPRELETLGEDMEHARRELAALRSLSPR